MKSMTCGLVVAVAVAWAGCGGSTSTDVASNEATSSVGSSEQAIVDGRLDGADHPYAGLVVFFDPVLGPIWQCSGALISPTTFLTAGHCTTGFPFDMDGDGTPEFLNPERAHIYFASDVDTVAGFPFSNADATGTSVPHPEFGSSFPNTRDIGVVQLDAPASAPRYASVAALGTLDEWQKWRRDNARLDIVGYGLQRGFPRFTGDGKRRATTVRFLQSESHLAEGYNIQLSENSNTGGSCFGDSGGPVLLAGTDMIVAVVSFGLNFTCTGVGFHYRTDIHDSQDFLRTVSGL